MGKGPNVYVTNPDELAESIAAAIAANTPVAPLPNIFTVKRSFARPADTNAYAANDAFADATSGPFAGNTNIFPNVARSANGSGKITDCIVSMSAASAFQGEIWVFDAPVTKTNDNSALSIPDPEILSLIGIIPFNTTDVTAVNSVSYVQGLDIRFTCTGGTRDLYYLVKVIAAFTPGNAEVFGITLHVEN